MDILPVVIHSFVGCLESEAAPCRDKNQEQETVGGILATASPELSSFLGDSEGLD